MKIKRIVLGCLVLSLLACNFVTQMVVPPTATPTLTPTATATTTPSPTFTPTPTPLVPAFIPPECAAVPLATLSPEQALQSTPEVEITEISMDQQLRILSELGQIIEEVYVYPDYNGRDLNEIQARYRAKIEAGIDTKTFYNEISTLIEELGDEHSFYLSPVEVEQSEIELRGDTEFVGVGIVAHFDTERGRGVVISTFPGSPAEHAGIQHHDSILFVDGEPIGDDTVNRIRGPQCSAVVLTVQSPGEAPRDVILLRFLVRGNPPIDARMVSTTDGSKIGYIFIPSFYDETLPGQIEDALNQFGPLDGLILDVRMNGGGSSHVAYPIMEYFVQGRLGEFVSRESRRPLELRANEIQNSQSVPLVVLVSEGTASFAEIFAGLLRDVRGARIVGQTSLGNVEVMRGFGFNDGSLVWLATETFDSAFSDTNWEETGIVPDVHAFAEWDTFYFETDPSLAAALDLLGHQ
ncbi:MAG TPA: S41 family peptidase [Anaerolineales bacterium]|nr:S41 family peptidase [Anaerolineales bacterium]